MDKQQKLVEMYEKLRSVGAIHTQTQFAQRIGYARTNVSRALNGDERYLSEKLFAAVEKAFPEVFGDSAETDMAVKMVPSNDLFDKTDLNKIICEAIGSSVGEINKLKDEVTEWQRKFFKLESEHLVLKAQLEAANKEIERLKEIINRPT